MQTALRIVVAVLLLAGGFLGGRLSAGFGGHPAEGVAVAAFQDMADGRLDRLDLFTDDFRQTWRSPTLSQGGSLSRAGRPVIFYSGSGFVDIVLPYWLKAPDGKEISTAMLLRVRDDGKAWRVDALAAVMGQPEKWKR